jgi:uncharacterized lipoprotein YddW (UPF0748 family)
MSLLCNEKNVIKNHPDWYAISREGKSTLEKKPYVDYYNWLCPSRDEVIKYIGSVADELCQFSELKGIHLDYIRYCDVILPIALQPKYNLVQDHEYPQFDFCYCEHCKKKFKNKFKRDLIINDKIENDLEWREFRFDSITNVVENISKVVRKRNKYFSAAVFPYPELAKKLVRQKWNVWNLDGAFPMIYNYFYNEDVNWIYSSTQKCFDSKPRAKDIFPGLYLPNLTGEELKQAIELISKTKAKGFCLFCLNDFKEEHLEVLKNIKM